MKDTANFRVDTKLAALLGENYRSSEQAIKELVDNAWDADAENVTIILPKPMTSDPIIISDDGSGMTDREIKTEYLVIASDRTSRKGERTIQKKRLVKGRKGIGKFAGLMCASQMTVESKARGKKTSISITKDELLKSRSDLENVDLPITIDDCPINEHGTLITLTSLNQNLIFPNGEKLRQTLVRDYGHEQGISIIVDGERVGIESIPGETYCEEKNIPGVGPVKLVFTVSEKPLKQSGIAIKVNEKFVGRPDYFGVNEAEHIPTKLTKRIYGEIHVNGLLQDVTADGGAIIENSQAYEKVCEYVSPILEKAIKEKYTVEVNLAKARHQKEINRQLERLPEHKRVFAKLALERVIGKFFDESDEKVQTVISVVMDALEKDEYYTVLQHIDDAKDHEIELFADTLNDFGLVDLALIARQATNRLKFLDMCQIIIDDTKSEEKHIHKALENNLWLFGHEYSLMSSNQSLKTTIDKYLDKKYTGNRATKRPDLLLSQDITRKYLLIEFKKPKDSVGREAESQALIYRDELNEYLHNQKIEIMVIGGKVDKTISSLNERPDVKFLSYADVLSNARTLLDWLVAELKTV